MINIQAPALALNKTVRLFPILFVQAYLAFTVILFAIGPWPWPVENPYSLYSFLIAAQFALFFGYIFALSRKPTIYTGRWTTGQLFNVSLMFGLIWVLPNFVIRLGLPSLDLSEIFTKLLFGLTDPGSAYVERLALEKDADNTGSLIAYLTIMVNAFLLMLLPLGLTFWTRLLPWKKCLFLLWIVLDICTWIASGTNKGLADLLILVPVFLIVRNPALIAKLNALRIFIFLSILSVGLYIFLIFFSSGMESRPGSASRTGADYTIGIEYDTSNIILKALPDVVQGGVASFCSYLTQGYYGLSMSLAKPFVWSYGLGHSYYLPSWYQKIDPTSDIAMLSYPGRVSLDSGWGYFDRWHSIYPWIASDIGFPGAVVAMFFLGMLFCKVWLDILWCKNPIAITLFAMLLILLFYVPANNQIFAFPANAVGFFVLFFWWILTRKMM